MLFLALCTALIISLAISLHDRSPKVHLRGTTLIGRRLQPSNLDFFGGHSISRVYEIRRLQPTYRHTFCRASCF